MREPNHNFPAQNRACVCITSQLYDRRALDVPVSTLPLVTSLTHLAYLTSTSPRIREILTIDGGLERLSAIVRNCLSAVAKARGDTLPHHLDLGNRIEEDDTIEEDQATTQQPKTSTRQLAASGGPFKPFATYASSSRQRVRPPRPSPNVTPQVTLRPGDVLDEAVLPTLTVLPASAVIRPAQINAVSGRSSMSGPTLYQRALLISYALALQSLVNVGVRGTESIRTRVVEAGVLNVVARVLAGYLDEREAAQAALRKSFGKSRETGTSNSNKRSPHVQSTPSALSQQVQLGQRQSETSSVQAVTQSPASLPTDASVSQAQPRGESPVQQRREARFMSAANNPRMAVANAQSQSQHRQSPLQRVQALFAPAPGNRSPSDDLRGRTIAPINIPGATARSVSIPRTTTTPSIPPTASTSALASNTENLAPSSLPSSFAPSPISPDEHSHVLPSLSEPSSRAPSRVGTPDNARGLRVPVLGRTEIDTDADPATGSSEDGDADAEPMPFAEDVVMRAVGSTLGGDARRTSVTSEDSITKPSSVMETESAVEVAADAASDSGQDAMEIDAQENLALASIADMNMDESTSTEVGSQQTIVPAGMSAAMDSAATARPAVPIAAAPTPQPAAGRQDRTHRHHHHPSLTVRSAFDQPVSDVGSGFRFRDEDVLLCLQLLAYLSKYPHIRAVFHDPSIDYACSSILSADEAPKTPANKADNVFLLVERYTIRPTSSTSHDRTALRLNPEITYWAGTIMRNACRKDDQRGGIRQCASMLCGAWETYPREFAKCRRCRKARYCSKECQSKAWAGGHRFWCSARDNDAAQDTRDLAALRNLPTTEQAMVRRYIEQYPYLATAPDALNELIRRLRYAQARNARGRPFILENFAQDVPDDRPVIVVAPPPAFNEDEGAEDDAQIDMEGQDDGGVVIADEAMDQTRDLLRVAEDADVFA